MKVGAFAVTGGNTSRLLPPMLQGVQSKKSQAGNVAPWGVHAENTTFVMRFVISKS